MSVANYYQCQLEGGPRGTGFLIAFIPAKYAIVGKVLRLKDEGGVWEDGWVVKRVFGGVDEVPNMRRAVKKHRKNTGDSLPKRKPEK